jgi:hypothetical protein
VAPSSLIDERFRRRVGLPCVRIGRKLGFTSDDVDELIRRSREVLTTNEHEVQHDIGD